MNLDKKQEREERHETSFKDKSISDKILFIVDFPFKWIRKLIIPPCEEEDYDNIYFIVKPAFLMPDYLYYFKL